MSVAEPEAASTIIDLQLIEKQEEINKLTKKLSSIEEENSQISKQNVINSYSLVIKKNYWWKITNFEIEFTKNCWLYTYTEKSNKVH